MSSGADRSAFDVLLIGSGLGASAAARALALDGQRVGFMEGVGRSRSLESEVGIVDPTLIGDAFGAGAPLGQSIAFRQAFIAESVDQYPTMGAAEVMDRRLVYRRLELELWARDRALQAGAIYLDGFAEGRVLPVESGLLTLTDEASLHSLTATTVGLCEGSDPRIAMRVGLRPDYSPEQQIHFARAIIARPPSDAIYRTGRTRTSWGMPIGVTVIPVGATIMVAVDSRIENVMRSSKSTQEALFDLLASPLGSALGLVGERLHTGIELTALRPLPKSLVLSHDRLLMGIDAAGLIDAREARRADATTRSGQQLAAYLINPGEEPWEVVTAPLVDQVKAVNPLWHGSRGTGFVEEAESAVSLITSLSRMGRGALGRWRKRV